MTDYPGSKAPRWQLDFPIRWDEDQYVTRRELAKFLTLGSALLVGATGVVSLLARRTGIVTYPPVRIAREADIPPRGTVLFRFPSPSDPCILLRLGSGRLAAYSQVCTHLSCAVIHEPGTDELHCPCHQGWFDGVDGRPFAGPPTRRLPRIALEERDGDVYAVGVEV